MGTTDPAAVLRPLLDDLRAQIEIYRKSRRIYMLPADRAERMRERQAWIDAIESLLDAQGAGAGGDTVAESQGQG